MATYNFDHYFRQLRKIEEHRTMTAEQDLRRLYKRLLKDTKKFLAEEYFELAKDGKLTYEILRAHGRDARMLEEMEQRLSGLSEAVSQDIRQTVETMYETAYNGMVDAVQKSHDMKELQKNLEGLRNISAETVKAAVENPVFGLTLNDTLEKNRKNIIWNIKRDIGIGLSQGDRYETMARRIAKSLDGDYKKAIRIVRTEAGRVREAGHLASATEINSALEGGTTDVRLVKKWKTVKDGAVRDQHEPMNNVVVAMDEDFKLPDGTTMPAPKQSYVAAQVINCRCFVKYELMDTKEFEQATGKQPPMSQNMKQIQNLEKKEKDLLDEKAGILADKATYEQEMNGLAQKQYVNIWKNPVTVKDYEALKDKIPAKRIYFDEQYALDGSDKWANLNKLLDEFEANGQKYISHKNMYDLINARVKVIDDDLKDTLAKLMKAKKIDPDKIKDDIAELKKQIDNIGVKGKVLDNAGGSGYADSDFIGGGYDKITVQDYLGDSTIKTDVDEYYNYSAKILKQKLVNNPDYKGVHYQVVKEIDEFYADVQAYQNLDAKQLAILQKQLKDKENELAAIIKRYGLEDDKFSQARKDAAYWFTDKNGGGKGADKVLRDKCGEVWRGATEAEKDWIYEYTRSYSKYNEPLRGIEYGTNKYLGVGNVDMDTIGMSYGGYKRGEIKAQINHITSIIDKSSYDFDMWFNRGCRRGGMDKFFGVDASVFDLPEAELAAKLVGTTPTEYGFMSTGVAKGKGFGGEFKLNIYAPAGTKMMYVEPFSAFGGSNAYRSWDGISKQSNIGYEAEMLFQRGTKFRVTKVEKSGGTIYVDLEVIGQEANPL